MGVAKIVERNEFKEIMSDFTNPLEIIREGIQNSIDSYAKTIIIDINYNNTSQGKSLDISIEDDGKGLQLDKFENFFDLGNSTKSDNPELIGEKGHGTKIFYNSNKVTVETWINSKKYFSILRNPYKKIFEGADLDYSDPLEIENKEGKVSGVKITVEGYLKNTSSSPLEKFSHPAIRDYILWFTAFGSIIKQFEDVGHINEQINRREFPTLFLKSFDTKEKTLQNEFNFNINKDGFEEIEYGHQFPDRNIVKANELKQLAKDNNVRNWEDLFCKKLCCREITIDGLENPIQVVIWAEGDKYKRLHNPLIRERIGSQTRDFQYKVSDRYGFWVCKNYIPIQKVDHWITGKGNYTKFHAFINYNDFSLTANRSSIENTRPEDLAKIKDKVDRIFEEVINDKDYKEWKDIEDSAAQERSASVEKKEFENRIKNCKKRKKIVLGNITYFEPEYEGEVALLFNGILENFPEVMNLVILDYNTYKGIDFLAKENNGLSPEDDRNIGYIELKYNLEKTRFNHSFKNLIQIVCFNTRGLKSDDKLTDLNGQTLKVVKNKNGYFLQDFNNEVGHNINILILKEFLEKNGLKFE